MFSRSAQRTTWQISRKQTIYPAAGSSTTFPTQAMVVIATYVGSFGPNTSQVLETPGAPLVAIDAWAFLPSGATVSEGDSLADLENNTKWEATKVVAYPLRTIVGLKAVASKSVVGAPAIGN
jgi:hypothetical protein